MNNFNSAILNEVGILVPCYNASSTIEETILSIEVALKEIDFNIPVYIYDDKSTDNSCELIERCIQNRNNFTLFKNEINAGQWETKNKAFTYFKEKYKWVFILHADDIAKPIWLKELLPIIEKETEQCFSVWSSYDVLVEPSKKITSGDNSGVLSNNKVSKGEKNNKINDLIIAIGTPWHISGAAINVKQLCSLGYFDQQFAHYGDSDIIFRAVESNLYYTYLGKSLIYYRIHNSSVSGVTLSTNRDLRESFLFIQKYKNILYTKSIKKIKRNMLIINLRRIVKKILFLKWNYLKDDFLIFLKLLTFRAN